MIKSPANISSPCNELKRTSSDSPRASTSGETRSHLSPNRSSHLSPNRISIWSVKPRGSSSGQTSSPSKCSNSTNAPSCSKTPRHSNISSPSHAMSNSSISTLMQEASTLMQEVSSLVQEEETQQSITSISDTTSSQTANVTQNMHALSQSNASNPLLIDSNVTSESLRLAESSHFSSEAQTLAQTLLEGSAEAIAIHDEVLDTVIEASEREGVPPLPEEPPRPNPPQPPEEDTSGSQATPVGVSQATSTGVSQASPITSTWENVRFLRVPRARPWESWTSPSPSHSRATSPSRIGGVEMLRVPSRWAQRDHIARTRETESILQLQEELRNNAAGVVNNAPVRNVGNNSGGGLYLLSRLMHPEVRGGANESQSEDTPTFSFLGRNRDRSPLRYLRSPVDTEIETAPSTEEVSAKGKV